jgi:hypothetical protein
MDDDCTVLLEPIYGRRDDLQVFHLGEDGQARAQRCGDAYVCAYGWIYVRTYFVSMH